MLSVAWRDTKLVTMEGYNTCHHGRIQNVSPWKDTKRLTMKDTKRVTMLSTLHGNSFVARCVLGQDILFSFFLSIVLSTR